MTVSRTRVQSQSLTWVEINTECLTANLQTFRRRLGNSTELAHAVKSNAYGHGLELVAKEDEATGLVDRLAVISVEELAAVRKIGVKLPVLVLGYVPRGAWDVVVDHEGTPVVANRESLELLSKASAERSRVTPVHLKIETGTHRFGIDPKDVADYADLIRTLPGIRLEGISTHFANIEDTTEHDYAKSQLAAFESVLRDLRQSGAEVPVPHTACSAAAILFPESHYSLARVGIASYGIWPSKETKVSAGHQKLDVELKPVLSWKTRIAQVKSVPAGAYVGYGCAWRAPVDTKLAILPVGYADGYDRKLSQIGHVLIGGSRAPVRGRVCMNITMVDVSHLSDVSLEQEVVLIGSQGDERIAAEDLAAWAGTIPYEIVARIAPHLPRILV